MTFENLLTSIQGLQVCEILVGPAGVHYNFGGATAESHQVGILSNAAITLQRKGGHLAFQTRTYPPFECADQLRTLLLGKRVLSAELDPAANTARIILDEAGLLSLTPQTCQQDDVCWSIHDERPESGTEKGYVVYSDTIVPIRAR